jgi:signal recognition particle subunit SRP54
LGLFDQLSTRLQDTFKRLRGKGKLTEKDITEAMRDIRMALLEADVNFKVVKEFTDHVKQRALGVEVLESLTPGHQVVKVVYDEMTALLGGSAARLDFGGQAPHMIMLVGLQGAGKTTTSAKLARLLQKSGHQPLMAAADIYRPAAIDQLQVLGRDINIPVFTLGANVNPVEIARQAKRQALVSGNDVVIVDTAGRLHVDEELMEELRQMKAAINPSEVLLVVDAMTGQDAVTVADAFNKSLEITGVIMSKMDSDTRGGAALSVKAVTGAPIKFATTGEKLDALEVFYPDRMASRILGMGDVLTMIERAEQSFDEAKAKELEKKIREQSFTLEDFMDQINQVRNMGPLDQLMGMIPGLNQSKLKGAKVDERELKHVEAIVQSMTPQERSHPETINGSRRKRIAAGSGTSVQDVNRLLKQFSETRKLMRQFAEKGGRRGKIRFPGM